MANTIDRVVDYWDRFVENRSYVGGVIFYGLLFVLVLPVVGRLVFSNDIFKALYSGRYLWWFGQFPHHSTFTFSPVLEFLRRDTFNWLGNLLLLGVFEFSGYTGLQVVRGILTLMIVGLMHSLFGWDRNPIFLVLFFFVVMSLSQKFLVRTALVAAPGVTLIFWIGVRGWEGSGRKLYWWFPPVLLIWSQIHGSYQLGLGLLFCLLLGDVLDSFLRSHSHPWETLVRSVAIVGVTLLAVTFVKPFPDYSFVQRVSSLLRPVSLVADQESEAEGDEEVQQRSTIGRPSTLPELSEDAPGEGDGEHNGEGNVVNEPANTDSAPQNEASPYYKKLKSILQSTVFKQSSFRSAEFSFPLEELNFLFVRTSLLLGGLGFIFLCFGTRRHIFALGIPFLAILVLGLGYLRTVGYLGIVPVFLLASHYKSRSWFLVRKRLVVVCVLTVVGLLTGTSLYLSATDSISGFTGSAHHELGYGRHLERTPEVPNYVLQNHPEERFFNSYGLGSYLIWQWWPHKKVFVDTKFSAYDPAFKKMIVETPLPETLRDRDLNHGIVEKDDLWDRYFRKNEGWTPVISQGEMAAHARKESLSPENEEDDTAR